MPYAFTHDIPANAEIYGKIRGKLGSETPKGLVAHVVQQLEGGLRYIDVWETKQDWEAFRDERVHPVVTEVLAGYGIEHTGDGTTFEEIEVIDAWIAA